MSEAPVSLGVLGALKEMFIESDLPYKVDIVDDAAASQQFQEIIQQAYEVVQQPVQAKDGD